MLISTLYPIYKISFGVKANKKIIQDFMLYINIFDTVHVHTRLDFHFLSWKHQKKKY